MIMSKVRKILYFLISRRATAVSNARDLTGLDTETIVLLFKRRSGRRWRPRRLERIPCELEEGVMKCT